MNLEKELVIKESEAIGVFFDFTRTRVLSVAAIEQLAEIPKNTLLNLLTTKRPIPANHIVSLVRVLENFGYQASWDWERITSQLNHKRLPITQGQSIYFYFNYPNRKLTLHKGKCSFCNEGLGVQKNVHGENNGGWRGRFDSYQSALAEAQVIAEEMGITPTNCKICNPHL